MMLFRIISLGLVHLLLLRLIMRLLIVFLRIPIVLIILLVLNMWLLLMSIRLGLGILQCILVILPNVCFTLPFIFIMLWLSLNLHLCRWRPRRLNLQCLVIAIDGFPDKAFSNLLLCFCTYNFNNSSF